MRAASAYGALGERLTQEMKKLLEEQSRERKAFVSEFGDRDDDRFEVLEADETRVDKQIAALQALNEDLDRLRPEIERREAAGAAMDELLPRGTRSDRSRSAGVRSGRGPRRDVVVARRHSHGGREVRGRDRVCARRLRSAAAGAAGPDNGTLCSGQDHQCEHRDTERRRDLGHVRRGNRADRAEPLQRQRAVFPEHLLTEPGPLLYDRDRYRVALRRSGFRISGAPNCRRRPAACVMSDRRRATSRPTSSRRKAGGSMMRSDGHPMQGSPKRLVRCGRGGAWCGTCCRSRVRVRRR